MRARLKASRRVFATSPSYVLPKNMVGFSGLDVTRAQYTDSYNSLREHRRHRPTWPHWPHAIPMLFGMFFVVPLVTHQLTRLIPDIVDELRNKPQAGRTALDLRAQVVAQAQ